jgi:ABC-type glycerol-3-phosphate transport system substrate-binding protein
MKSKTLVLLLSIITLISTAHLFAGGKQPKPGEKAVITCMGWDQMTTEYMAPAVELFKEKHPEVEFNLVNLAYDEASEKIVVGMSSGVGAPDIFINDPHWQPKYLELGGLYDVSPIVEPWKDDILPEVWNLIAVRGGDWRIPLAYNPNFFFYRKDVFDEVGVEAPKDWTSDFMSIAAKVCRDGDGDGEPDRYLGDLAAWATVFFMIGREENFSVDQVKGEPNLVTPGKIEVLEWMKDVVDKGYMRYGNFLEPEQWELMKRDVSVAQVAPFWYPGFGLKQMGYKAELEGQWRMSMWPAWKPGEPFPGGSHGSGGWGVYAETKYPKLCMEFLEWYMTPEGTTWIAVNRGLGPVTFSGIRELENDTDVMFGDQLIWKLIEDAGDIGNEYWYSKNWVTIDAALQTAVDAIIEKDMPVEDALKRAQDDALAQLK